MKLTSSKREEIINISKINRIENKYNEENQGNEKLFCLCSPACLELTL